MKLHSVFSPVHSEMLNRSEQKLSVSGSSLALSHQSLPFQRTYRTTQRLAVSSLLLSSSLLWVSDETVQPMGLRWLSAVQFLSSCIHGWTWHADSWCWETLWMVERHERGLQAWSWIWLQGLRSLASFRLLARVKLSIHQSCADWEALWFLQLSPC